MAKRPLDFQMGVEDEILAELRRILEQAASEIQQELSEQADSGIGEALQRAQAEAIAKAVKQHLKGDWDSISSVLSEARKLAAMASVEAFYDQIGDPLGKLLGKDGAESLVSAESVRAANTINTVMARLSDSRRSLSQQVWKSQAMANGWLDSKINQALARGWDAKRLAKEVVSFVDPNTPGGASYAAMRLARTEINNAFHSQTIEQMRKSGVVEYVKWNLSRSHPDRDICDDLAEHRLGEPIPGAPEPDSSGPSVKSNPEDWDGDLDEMRQILNESSSATDSLRKILSDRGWTEGSTVLGKSGFENLESSAEIWRGLKNSEGTTTEQMMDDFAKSKDPFIGAGIYGNGWYFAKSKDVAAMYAGWDGRVYRSKVSKDANMFEILDDEVDIFSLPEFAWTRDQKYSGTAIQTDPSVAAAMMGYDGFIIHERGPSRTNIFYNLWNRSRIYVEDWT